MEPRILAIDLKAIALLNESKCIARNEKELNQILACLKEEAYEGGRETVYKSLSDTMINMLLERGFRVHGTKAGYVIRF